MIAVFLPIWILSTVEGASIIDRMDSLNRPYHYNSYPEDSHRPASYPAHSYEPQYHHSAIPYTTKHYEEPNSYTTKSPYTIKEYDATTHYTTKGYYSSTYPTQDYTTETHYTTKAPSSYTTKGQYSSSPAYETTTSHPAYEATTSYSNYDDSTFATYEAPIYYPIYNHNSHYLHEIPEYYPNPYPNPYPSKSACGSYSDNRVYQPFKESYFYSGTPSYHAESSYSSTPAYEAHVHHQEPDYNDEEHIYESAPMYYTDRRAPSRYPKALTYKSSVPKDA